MGESLLVTAEESSIPPILIIDREGSVGLGLCAKLHKQAQIVFVSNRKPEEEHHILYLPFSEDTPEIPSDQYSHIFYVVHDEKREAEVLTGCIKKAQHDGSYFSLLLDKRKLGKDPSLFLPQSLRYGAVMVLGDLFNIPVSKKHAFVLEQLFHQAKVEKKLLLTHMGLLKVFPVAYLDAIDCVLQIAFSGKAKKGVFAVYPPFAVTELGVARALQKAEPAITVDFVEERTEKKEIEIQEGEYVLPEEYPVFELLQKAFEEFLGEKGSQEVVPIETQTFSTPLVLDKIEKKKTKKRNVSLSFSGFLVTLVLLPAIVTYGALSLGKIFLLSAKNQGLSGQVSQSLVSVRAAKSSFAIAQASNAVFSLEAFFPPFSSLAGSWKDDETSGTSLAEGAENLLSAALKMERILHGTDAQSETDVRDAIQQARSGYAQLQSVATSSFLPSDVNSHLTQALQAITPLVNVSELLPSALGLEKQKTYLVLFQNNTELRPGGGFIGSYGLLTMEKGKVKDFTIHDVYEADGQLKGHVEPPFPIRRYMGNVHLYLRDSNFDVDFSKDAFLAAEMLHFETNQTVDGVIGVDLSFVRNMLAGIGPLTLADYKQTVTADNFFTLAETHAEKNFFPGSTQKKDFLSSVFAALKTRFDSGAIPYEKVAQSVLTSLTEKHVLFASADASEQDVLTANNLSSALWDSRPTGQINDFLGINEANIGVNKVNYYIDRSVEQHVTLTTTGDVQTNTTLTLVNKSTPKDAYTGEYKSYVRFILPEKADLTGISIDGQDQTIVPAVTDFSTYEKKTFKPPVGLEVDKEIEQGKAVYGMVIPVAQQGSRKITVSYILRQAVDTTKTTATYSLKFFKQPGTEKYPYIFSFSYPNAYQVVSANEGLQKKEEYVSFNSTVDTDKTFSVYLGKK